MKEPVFLTRAMDMDMSGENENNIHEGNLIQPLPKC